MIYDLQTNYQTNPLGISLKNISFSWKVQDEKESTKIIIATDDAFKNIVFEKEVFQKDGIAFTPDFNFAGGVKYYWRVGNSDIASFEGGHPADEWMGYWIKPCFTSEISPVFKKTFELKDVPNKSRLYICGLGLYEVYINGEKVGDEFLTPYFTDYRFWLQYQTYDATDYLKQGQNTIVVMMGEGWYKGRLGYLDHGLHKNHYGNEFKLLCDLYIYDKGVSVIGTDTSWSCNKSALISSNIYDGEIFDGREQNTFTKQQPTDLKASKAEAIVTSLEPMTGVGVKCHEKLKVKEIITSKIGETILDFGQEISGWVTFKTDKQKGTQVKISYSEIMQEGKFYRDNLRTAACEYTFICDGTKKFVRPHFTYYGFRYVKVEGMEINDTNVNDFEAWALYSDLKETGDIKTSDEKLNRLILNTKWSQKDNFIDVPTDCPQRDERLGWTGDAQIFSGAASCHMQTPAFYRKYLKDMLYEQKIGNGAVPYVVPDVLSVERMQNNEPAFDLANDRWGETGSSVWGDAATIIPWNMYIHYGNKKWLEEEYENMTQWVDFMRYMDETHCGGKRLWNCGFHFGDWLSLDAENDSCEGGTDKYYISSVYYYYSSLITSKAAGVLGKKEDEKKYKKLSDEVLKAVRKEYILSDGSLKYNTQTAYAVAIEFDVFTEEEKEAGGKRLAGLIEKYKGKLSTGFVGTAFLLGALVHTGYSDLAYNILFNEEYPGWLYEVNLGATTIWERWNSVLPNGLISSTGMNSLNHYAYGCVVEWIYKYVIGLEFTEENPAGEKMKIHPRFTDKLDFASGHIDTMIGKYFVEWKRKEKNVTVKVLVPFGGQALFEACGVKKILDAGEHKIELEV